MSEIAEELSRRASPQHMKAQLKERAVERGYEIRDRFVESPLTYRIGGGILGALIAGAISRRIVERRRPLRWEGDLTWYEPGTAHGGERAAPIEEQGAGLKEQASERVEELKGKASSAAHRARSVAVEARGRAAGWSQETWNEQPLMFALGALALGAALGAVLPVTRRERRAFSPARERAGEKLGQVVERVEEKIRGAGEAVRGAERPSVTGQPSSPGAGPIPSVH